MTSRVEGDPIDAAWRASCRGTPFATIDLGPLRAEEALSLAGGFIDATQRVALACIERAGGNPLFLEQLSAQRRGGRGRSDPAFDPKPRAGAHGPAARARPPGVSGRRRHRTAL